MKKISARRDGISFLAEAHEMEHLGAEKTARRLWDLGFDWLGLLQDCEVITSVSRPCVRDNLHRTLWAPALSLEGNSVEGWLGVTLSGCLISRSGGWSPE